MRVGVVLPTFEHTADDALLAAGEAEREGLHGVFAYDHLWPMGQPGRPAISPYPLLGAVASRTRRVAVGTLVARVGLVPDDVLVAELLAIDVVSGGRAVASVGTGDAKSSGENRAYGVGFPPARERRERLAAIVTQLRSSSVTTWVGGGSDATNAVARATGAALNLWGAPPATVAAAAATGEVTWGGMLPESVTDSATLLAALDRAGASWAVVGWPGSCDMIVAAASTAGLSLG